ncbi:MAG: hypothetical protein ACHQNV_10265 [Vicinamibacteria bacterium]
MPWRSPVWYGFDKGTINGRAPNVSGVYALKGPDGRWLYFGEAASIAASLLRHLSSESARLTEGRAATFSYELCSADERAKRRDALAAELLPAPRPPGTP